MMTIPIRRLVWWLAVITAFVVAILACWQDPVYTAESCRTLG
jgi:hypothetical protein